MRINALAGILIASTLTPAFSQTTSKSTPFDLDPIESDVAYHEDQNDNPLIQNSINKIRAQFESVRLSEPDFKLSAGWPLPYTISAIENFFNKPLDIPTTASDWTNALEDSETPTDLLTVAMSILDGPRQPLRFPESHTPVVKNEGIPNGLRAPIGILLNAIARAQPLLNKAVDSVPAKNRSEFLKLNEWPNADTGAVEQEISARRIKQQYEGMKTFSESDLYNAAQIIFEGVGRAQAKLSLDAPFSQQFRWTTPNGDVLIRGTGDDTYDAETLKNVVLLIDLGGRNTYKAPVATAHEKQIRIVIDFGSEISVQGDTDLFGNAGAGVFGIGIMVCPNEDGEKEFHTGSFSQGLGLAGVGALIVNGTAHFSAQKFVQGMGMFGVGILVDRDAKESSYVATRNGQGSAFTRGVGIFFHEGDGGDIKGGLVQPDPREPSGSVSLCQGVGFGPRAYAGGGVGLAVVKGDNNAVKGSYFSQGVGYWHGFGVFRVRGNGNTLQARRYDLGSGVHSAFGHLDVLGNKNRVLNWGVGPAYGWDRSIGSALIFGNDNEMQTEWGSGTASIGSLSFSAIRGERNKLKLCDHGTNNFVRDEPAYSIQLIEGTDIQFQCEGAPVSSPPSEEDANTWNRRLRSPWGTYQFQGVTFVDNLGLKAPEWPPLPQEDATQREMVDLQQHLKDASSKSPIDEVNDLVDVAAAFSLDKASPRQAMRALIMLPPEKAALLAKVLDPAAVDQLIQLAVAIPSHGAVTANALIDEATTETAPMRRATLINFLRSSPPSIAFPALTKMLQEKNTEETRVMLIRTMADLLSRDTGGEPGARALYDALAESLENVKNKSKKQAALKILQQMRFSDSVGVMAGATDLNQDKRTQMLAIVPEDITGALLEPEAKEYLRILYADRADSLARVNNERKVLEGMESSVREQLVGLLESTRPATVNAAVIGIGKLANEDDIAKIEPLLKHANTRVRESAAVALGRMAPASLPALARAQNDADIRTRALAMVAVTQSVSPKAEELITVGLKDNDPLVRLTAVSAVANLPPCLQSRSKKIVATAKKRISFEKDPNVNLALQLLK